MSVSYNFITEANLKPKDVLAIAANVNNVKVNEEREPVSFRVPGAFAVSTSTDDWHESNKNKWIEGYGFHPAVSTTIERYAREGQEESLKAVSRAIVALFQTIEAKAVLLYDYDTTIVQRLNGKIEIQQISGSSDYDWIAKAFDELEIDYERKPLTSPLLN